MTAPFAGPRGLRLGLRRRVQAGDEPFDVAALDEDPAADGAFPDGEAAERSQRGRGLTALGAAIAAGAAVGVGGVIEQPGSTPAGLADHLGLVLPEPSRLADSAQPPSIPVSAVEVVVRGSRHVPIV